MNTNNLALLNTGFVPYHHRFWSHPETTHGGLMAKGMQQSKMVKKPKKDTSPPKEFSSDRPMPPVTTVPLRGKLKNK